MLRGGISDNTTPHIISSWTETEGEFLSKGGEHYWKNHIISPSVSPSLGKEGEAEVFRGLQSGSSRSSESTWKGENMVSYYNPATAVAMFGRSGSGYHHHHHHSPPTQNHPYFTPGAYGAGYHHNPHSHHAGHQAAAVAGGTGGSGSPVGSGLGAPALPGGVSSTQFSPNMATDFNCNHQYNSHFSNMTPDSMAVWATQSSMYSSACAAAAARNAAAVAAAGLTSVAAPPPPPPPAPHSASFDDWSGPHHPHHLHPHAYQHHPHHPHSSFYNPHANVQQPSPPSSTPSSPSSSHSPSHNVYSASSSTPNNNSNSNNNNTSFKAEFGPCSGGNNQV